MCEAEKDDDTHIEESKEEEEENSQAIALDSKGEITPRVSIEIMIGLNQPQTLKLRGHIRNNNVIVLVYTRSTHTCIDINVARRLKLFVYPISYMMVQIERK